MEKDAYLNPTFNFLYICMCLNINTPSYFAVDVALQTLQDAVTSGNTDQVHEISVAIQMHIDELEEFLSDNQTGTFVNTFF